ncbi:hypothetical protein [Sphingomicrobium lutaoense]|uniref:Uncharacterized protein n=1 Tax=Sphingomicrobium lutaoense TaxID=515949 RepID=A0A839Z052_9SPHN|nr:hypothetical protein [Sphingomicrobium lutaoense]MBB3764739.1 hypothetical protein [Sphingomicrobium lutaoense]
MLVTSFIIAVLGCGHGEDVCTARTAAPTLYANEEVCTAALDEALYTAPAIDAPVVAVECQPLTERNAALLRKAAPRSAALER